MAALKQHAHIVLLKQQNDVHESAALSVCTESPSKILVYDTSIATANFHGMHCEAYVKVSQATKSPTQCSAEISRGAIRKGTCMVSCTSLTTVHIVVQQEGWQIIHRALGQAIWKKLSKLSPA